MDMMELPATDCKLNLRDMGTIYYRNLCTAPPSPMSAKQPHLVIVGAGISVRGFTDFTPQIFAYWQSLYKKHGLERHTKFQTSVHEAEWDEERQVWRVTLRKEKTGKYMEEMIDLKISGSSEDSCGGWQWVFRKTFDSLNLIGRVINFIRSPQWLVPMVTVTESIPILLFDKMDHSACSFGYEMVQECYFGEGEFLFFEFADIESLVFREKNKRPREVAVKGLTSCIKSVAPASLWGKLIPDYPVGTKQIIVDPKYLESLGRPNVELQTEPIESLVRNGIRTKDGKIVEVDAVVFATGYSLEPTNLRIRGLNGKTIREYFDEHGDQRRISVETFLGANAATGHASFLFNMEAQIQLAIQLAAPIIQNFKKLQSRIAGSVWPDCGESYYNVDGTSRTKNIAMVNIAMVPGPAMLFWWFARKPRWGSIIFTIFNFLRQLKTSLSNYTVLRGRSVV
ncbi:hypothetical protein DFJ43DRAFT_1139404 [Lentinula guzmanii]|uniref:FAD/NAD(P)-binding domain-containing protein n=1 Tax=Lentinula guzmanii TaxID=2804957 RepID=A0AA38MSZ7_9AGAR|nr:hypothetical protein DFJ43DRAFT_1139404 [Lentinula guzmanii]